MTTTSEKILSEMERMGRMKIKDLCAQIGWQYQKFRRRIKAIDKATIPAPRERDEIDEWLETECNIHAGCCSSIENLKYDVAREVAEKLWNKNK